MALRRVLFFLVSSALIHAQTPLIWFCPLDPILRPEVGYGGSPQYMQLFVPDAPWTQAASRINVFKIYPQWISEATDADLKAQFADLDRRGIALALEWGMLTPSATCGRGVEGFGGPSTLTALRRIHALGGKLSFIAMDEPIYFGTLYKGQNACNWTLPQMAENAAANIKALQNEFPDVQVGDIEPLPDDADPNWLDQYTRGIDALQTATGKPLAFFHTDIAWTASNKKWQAAIASMRQIVADRGLPFGVIYNSGDSQQTDARWLSDAESHMVTYENGVNPPDHIIFQSWNAYPKTLLPETNAETFTNLVNRYFRARTQLTANAPGDGSFSGTLTTSADGMTVAGVPIRLAASPLTGAGVETQYTSEGTTPQNLRNLVLGLRINLECNCGGPSDIAIRSFRFESGDVSIQRDFSAGLNGWSLSDPALAKVQDDGQLHVRTADAQPLLLNSAPIAFANGNQPFKLTVTATVTSASAGSGYFAGIFLGDTAEITRARIAIAGHDIDLGSAMTDSTGQFQFTIPALAPAGYLLRAAFAGDQALWPANAEVTLPAASSIRP